MSSSKAFAAQQLVNANIAGNLTTTSPNTITTPVNLDCSDTSISCPITDTNTTPNKYYYKYYKDGGIQGQDWDFISNKPVCDSNWGYFDKDSNMINPSISSSTTINKSAEWCKIKPTLENDQLMDQWAEAGCLTNYPITNLNTNKELLTGSYANNLAAMKLYSTGTDAKNNYICKGGDVLLNGRTLASGGILYAAAPDFTNSTKNYKIQMQTNGNLVISDNDNIIIWSLDTINYNNTTPLVISSTMIGGTLVMQTNGNLAAVNTAGKIYWQTNTTGTGVYAVMQPNGIFALYDNTNKNIWSSAPNNVTPMQQYNSTRNKIEKKLQTYNLNNNILNNGNKLFSSNDSSIQTNKLSDPQTLLTIVPKITPYCSTANPNDPACSTFYNSYTNNLKNVLTTPSVDAATIISATNPTSASPIICIGNTQGKYNSISQNGSISIGTTLNQCQQMISPSGTYVLNLQTDGNLIIYQASNSTALWSTKTPGVGMGPYSLQYQSNGNLILLDSNNITVWQTNTTNTTSTKLTLADTGNLVFYNGANAVIEYITNSNYPQGSYSKYAKIDYSSQINLSTINNTTVQNCNIQCDNTQGCTGFAFNNSTNACNLKGNVVTSASLSPNTDYYYKGIAPTQLTCMGFMKSNNIADRTGSISVGTSLYSCQQIVSANGAYILSVQTDGNLIIYSSNGSSTWSTGSGGRATSVYSLQYQANGNLLLTDSNNNTIYSFITNNTTTSTKLTLTNNGNLILYNGSNAVWELLINRGYNIYSGTNYAQNPISNPSYNTTVQSCLIQCDNTPNCFGFDFYNNACSMYGPISGNPVSSNANFYYTGNAPMTLQTYQANQEAARQAELLRQQQAAAAAMAQAAAAAKVASDARIQRMWNNAGCITDFPAGNGPSWANMSDSQMANDMSAWATMRDGGHVTPCWNPAMFSWNWSTMPANNTLSSGRSLISPNAYYRATMQSNGEFAIYYIPTGNRVWSLGMSVQPGAVFTLTNYYASVNVPGGPSLWNYNGPITGMNMQDDGDLAIFNGNTRVWYTGSAGRR